MVSALWGAAAPFIGPRFGITLDSQLLARIVGHLVPGVVAAAGASVTVARETRGRPSQASGAFASLLGGVWMVGTHVALVAQAVRGGAGWLPTLFHALPGAGIVLASATLVLMSVSSRYVSRADDGRNGPTP